MKIHETSFLFALIRFISILVIFYFIRKPIKTKKNELFSDFFIVNISKYISVSIVTIFLLTLIGAFNLFNYLICIIIFLIFDLNNFNSPKIIYNSLKDSFEKLTTEYVGFIETPDKKTIIKNYLKTKSLNIDEKYDLISVLFVVILAFISRMYFYTNDLFLFSENWFADFEKLALIQEQEWFNTEYQEMGEYALITLFSHFFKVSPGMSLQMFGLLQTIILSVLVFFIVKNTSKTSNVFVPLLATIIFFGGFSILPIDLTSIFKHRKIFTVLIILFPMALKATEKQHFYKFRSNLILLSFSFVAISLTQFASMAILVAPTFIVLIIFNNNKTLGQKITLFLLPFAVGLLTLTFFMMFYEYGHFNIDFFLKNSFIEVSNYTKTENLYFEYEIIIKYISISCALAILINILTDVVNIVSVIVCVLYLLTAALYHTSYYLIDKNLLLLIFSILTPISIGMIISELLLNKVKWIAPENSKLLTFTILLITFFLGGIYQKNFMKKFKESNETNRQLLSTYDKIITNHLPYSYAVVNHRGAITFSKSNHFFINYNELNRTYIKKDSVFHTNKKKPNFLREHPEAIIPNSIFLFEILGVDKNVSRIGFLTSKNQLKQNDSIISILKLRGRDISLFTDTERLRVYKITNKKNSSNIDKMLFYDNRSKG